MEIKMTKSEAISKGYEKCGYSGRDWQTLMDVEDVDEVGFNYGRIVLASKDSSQHLIDWTDLRDRAMDDYFNADEHQDDDYNGLESDLNELKDEFEKLAEKINNSVFDKRKWWMLTEIELMPNQ